MKKRNDKKHRCIRCGNKALYRRPRTGKLVARKDHELCQRCFRSDCDSARAKHLKPPKTVKVRSLGKSPHGCPVMRVVSVSNRVAEQLELHVPSHLNWEKTP